MKKHIGLLLVAALLLVNGARPRRGRPVAPRRGKPTWPTVQPGAPTPVVKPYRRTPALGAPPYLYPHPRLAPRPDQPAPTENTWTFINQTNQKAIVYTGGAIIEVQANEQRAIPKARRFKIFSTQHKETSSAMSPEDEFIIIKDENGDLFIETAETAPTS